MIEYFRKYSGIAFVVLILLFLGLIFMVEGVSQGGMGSGPKLMSYDGRGYKQSDVERQGADYLHLFGSVSQAGASAYMDMVPYMRSVVKQDPRDYLANRLLLKKVGREYGISANQTQIEAFVTERLFTDANGEFDQVSYNDFINKRVMKAGLGVQDFNELIGEILVARKLQDFIGSGISLDKALTRKSAKVMSQEVTYEQYSLPIANLRENMKATEEEVKAHWEENKNKFLSAPMAKIQYVISDADLTTATADHKKKVVAQARQDGKTEEEIKALDYTLPVEEKSALVNVAGDKVDRLFVMVQDSNGSGFEAHAKELGLEVKTSELFHVGQAPDEINQPLFQTKGTVSDHVFQLSESPDSMDSISDVLSLAAGKYVMFKVIEKKEAVPEAYEVARRRAEVDLLDSRASDQLDEEVNKVQEKLIAAIKGGKDPKAAAEELKLLYYNRQNLKMGQPIDGEPAAMELFNAAALVEVNDFSEPIIQNEEGSRFARAVFVRPTERTYVNSEENKAAVESMVSQSGSMVQMVAFENWFQHQLAQSAYEKY